MLLLVGLVSLGGVAGAVLLGLLLAASPPATRLVRSRLAGRRTPAAVEPSGADDTTVPRHRPHRHHAGSPARPPTA